jgi:hypothetical protein
MLVGARAEYHTADQQQRWRLELVRLDVHGIFVDADDVEQT